jgi:hypothetical protein
MKVRGWAQAGKKKAGRLIPRCFLKKLNVFSQFRMCSLNSEFGGGSPKPGYLIPRRVCVCVFVCVWVCHWCVASISLYFSFARALSFSLSLARALSLSRALLLSLLLPLSISLSQSLVPTLPPPPPSLSLCHSLFCMCVYVCVCVRVYVYTHARIYIHAGEAGRRPHMRDVAGPTYIHTSLAYILVSTYIRI